MKDTVTMTLHRALAELKLIDKKIARKLQGLDVIEFTINGEQTVNSQRDVETYNKEAVGQVDSIEALIKRKSAIKNAIILKNSETKITVNDEEMTISDAIAKKDEVQYLRDFADVLNTKYRNALAESMRYNERVIEGINKIVSGDDPKSLEMRESLIEKDKVKLVDPVDIKAKRDSILEYVDNFESEVDSVLSEANAITTISL